MTTESIATTADPVDESTLVTSVHVGNPESCGEFVAHFGGPVYNYLYWLTGDANEAATIFKETVLHLYLTPSRVRKERSVRDWVYRQATQIWLSNRQRQRQRRSSLDFILRGGLNKTENAPWTDWVGQCTTVTGLDISALEPVVDGLIDLADHERAALLLTAIVGLPLKSIMSTLGLSSRKTRRHLCTAFRKLAVADTASSDSGAHKVNTLVQRRILDLESAGQARKLDRLLEGNPGYESIVSHNQAVFQRLHDLPAVAVPTGLARATTTHLAEGHAALETRIADWGFRFMQITVPLFIIGILGVILFPALSRSREMARRAWAAENLHTLGKALRAYSEASYGKRYPTLTSQKGLWVPELSGLYPQYIQDPAILVNPSLNDPSQVTRITDALNQSPPDWETAESIFAESYVYTGYTLLNTEALVAFIQTRYGQDGLDLEGDIETADHRFFRLRKGVEQFFAGALNTETGRAATTPLKIPVMFEVYTSTGFGGNPEGANVLYLDGTVAYVSFGSAFPVDDTVMALLKRERRSQ